MKDFRDLFPVTNDYVYLNTASCGLLSRSLVEWRHQHDLNLLHGGSLFRDLHKAHIVSIRETVGKFFSTSESNVALVPNFSFGFNVVVEGLPSKSRILLLKEDYPSVNWPLEHRGFERHYVNIDASLEQNIVEAIEDFRPDVFAFSMVQYVSGIKMDMDFLSLIKERYPELLLVVDGTQFLGTCNFDFDASAIDVVGASAYKWLLAGYGNGVFLINKRAQSMLKPKTIGYNSGDAQFGANSEIEFVGHLEPGHQDTLNYGSLEESIRFLNEIGIENIDTYLDSLCVKAQRAFRQKGLLDSISAEQSHPSTIFNIRGDENLFNRLKDNGIICSRRGSGIRVSFHLYNTEEDLDRLLTFLD